MLAFIDESGDSGLKIDDGSSKYFVVSLVVFEEPKEAEACAQRIELLKGELGWNARQEFHYKRNSNKVREAFLQAVSPYNFFYYGVVINKDPNKLFGDGFKYKASFYKYACRLVFENAKDKLSSATVVIDESGNLDFRKQLGKYLKIMMNTEDKKIKKVKQQRSESNNLLQLADYMAGVIYGVVRKKENAATLRKLIAHREMYIQVWPK